MTIMLRALAHLLFCMRLSRLSGSRPASAASWLRSVRLGLEALETRVLLSGGLTPGYLLDSGGNLYQDSVTGSTHIDSGVAWNTTAAGGLVPGSTPIGRAGSLSGRNPMAGKTSRTTTHQSKLKPYRLVALHSLGRRFCNDRSIEWPADDFEWIGNRAVQSVMDGIRPYITIPFTAVWLTVLNEDNIPIKSERAEDLLVRIYHSLR
jgi:hypothetical protein